MAASPFDLTTVDDVITWLKGSGTTDSQILDPLITSASRLILNQLSRGSILPAAAVDVVDARGGYGVTLARYPVISVQSVLVCGVAISPASSPTDFGRYLLNPVSDGFPPGQPQQLLLAGGARMPSLPAGVTVNYTAGYQVTAEPATIIAGNQQVQVAEPHGPWASNVAVTRADGTAMVKVASAPAVGQYALLPNEPGTYQFSAADAGTAVLISYGFTPQDLAMACIETVAERYKSRDRVGMSSQTVGGVETTSYTVSALNPHVLALIAPYKRVAFG